MVVWVCVDGIMSNVCIIELFKICVFECYFVEFVGFGDIVVIVGFENIIIGEIIVDLEDVCLFFVIMVDDFVILMMIGINILFFMGKVKGYKFMVCMVKDCFDKEFIGNVLFKVVDIGCLDVWEVQGCGELVFVIFVENMWCEGFEFMVGKLQVVMKKIDGKIYELFEYLMIDMLEEYFGVIMQLLVNCKGCMENMINYGIGWVCMEFIVLLCGLIGFCSEFFIMICGIGIVNVILYGYELWVGFIMMCQNGLIVVDCQGVVILFVMIVLQECMLFFVQFMQEVYEGMVIGENLCVDDMDVNIIKEKKFINMCVVSFDMFELMMFLCVLIFEESFEFVCDDECVEVMFEVVCICKVIFDQIICGCEVLCLKCQDVNV